jgi:hypothetical protein
MTERGGYWATVVAQAVRAWLAVQVIPSDRLGCYSFAAEGSHAQPAAYQSQGLLVTAALPMDPEYSNLRTVCGHLRNWNARQLQGTPVRRRRLYTHRRNAKAARTGGCSERPDSRGRAERPRFSRRTVGSCASRRKRHAPLRRRGAPLRPQRSPGLRWPAFDESEGHHGPSDFTTDGAARDIPERHRHTEDRLPASFTRSLPADKAWRRLRHGCQGWKERQHSSRTTRRSRRRLNRPAITQLFTQTSISGSDPDPRPIRTAIGRVMATVVRSPNGLQGKGAVTPIQNRRP